MQPWTPFKDRRLTADEKGHRFERYYAGWSAYLKGEGRHPPAGWSVTQRDLFFKGFDAAKGAADALRKA